MIILYGKVTFIIRLYGFAFFLEFQNKQKKKMIERNKT